MRKAGNDLQVRIVAGEGHQNNWIIAIDKFVLRSVNYLLTGNEIIGLMEPKGSGKPTLFYLLAGFDPEARRSLLAVLKALPTAKPGHY